MNKKRLVLGLGEAAVLLLAVVLVGFHGKAAYADYSLSAATGTAPIVNIHINGFEPTNDNVVRATPPGQVYLNNEYCYSVIESSINNGDISGDSLKSNGAICDPTSVGTWHFIIARIDDGTIIADLPYQNLAASSTPPNGNPDPCKDTSDAKHPVLKNLICNPPKPIVAKIIKAIIKIVLRQPVEPVHSLPPPKGHVK